MRKYLMLTVLLLVLLAPAAQAQWSGSQSVTWERGPSGDLLQIYTSVVGYSFSEDWMLAIVADQHPVHGLNADLSTTRYLRPLGTVLYTTVGIRRGVWKSVTGWVPYLTVTYRF